MSSSYFGNDKTDLGSGGKKSDAFHDKYPYPSAMMDFFCTNKSDSWLQPVLFYLYNGGDPPAF